MNAEARGVRPIIHAQPRGWSFWIVFGTALGLAMLVAPLLSPKSPRPADAEVWAFISRIAPAQGIEPRFAYAIAVAESRLNPDAFTHGSRGLMQMRWDAWSTITDAPFCEAWDWQSNAANAVAYLAWCRNFLEQHNALSPAQLAACYRYGPQAMADAEFQVANLPRPRNVVYRQLFNGDPGPVPPPGN